MLRSTISKTLRSNPSYFRNDKYSNIVLLSSAMMTATTTMFVTLQQQEEKESNENETNERNSVDNVTLQQQKFQPFSWNEITSMTTTNATLCESNINRQHVPNIPHVSQNQHFAATSDRNHSAITRSKNFIADAAEIALPSVVHIHVNILNQKRKEESNNVASKEFGTGSGFVVNLHSIRNDKDDATNNNQQGSNDTTATSTKDIFIATNAHVLLTPHEFKSLLQQTTTQPSSSSSDINHTMLVLNQQTQHNDTLKDRDIMIRTHDNHVLHGKMLFVDVHTDLALVQILLPTSSSSNVDNGQEEDNLQKSSSSSSSSTPPNNNSKFPSSSSHNLFPPSAKIGTSSTLRHGEFVIALGSPLSLHNSCTMGIVSNPNRSIRDIILISPTSSYSSSSSSSSKATQTTYLPTMEMTYIQTDASINIGNSGGPLINLDGYIVGMNTLKHPYGEGVGFALRIDDVMDVLGCFYREHYN